MNALINRFSKGLKRAHAKYKTMLKHTKAAQIYQEII